MKNLTPEIDKSSTILVLHFYQISFYKITEIWQNWFCEQKDNFSSIFWNTALFKQIIVNWASRFFNTFFFRAALSVFVRMGSHRLSVGFHFIQKSRKKYPLAASD